MKAIFWVKALPLRAQLAVIGFGYTAVLVYAVAAEYMRYVAAVKDPVSSSGGMWAFGDELLAWNLFLSFMVPTFFLLVLVRRDDGAYVKFSKVLFWFSLTAPLCLGVFVIAAMAHAQNLADPLLWRNWRGPFALMVIATSRFLARPPMAKRLLTRACLIEGGAFSIFVALILFSGK